MNCFVFNIIKLTQQKKVNYNFKIEQVHRILFFLKFMLLWKADENVIGKKL